MAIKIERMSREQWNMQYNIRLLADAADAADAAVLIEPNESRDIGD